MAMHHILRDRYHEAQTKHRDLAIVSDEQLDQLDEENSIDAEKRVARRFFFVITILPITFFVCTFTAIVSWRWVTQVAKYIYDSKLLVAASNSFPFAAGSCLCLAAVLTYFVIFPILVVLGVNILPFSLTKNSERKWESEEKRRLFRNAVRSIWTRRYLFKTLLVVWLFAAWGLTAFASVNKFLLESIIIWMVPLVALIAVGPFFVTVTLNRWRERRYLKGRPAAAASIAAKLLEMLSDWPKCENLLNFPKTHIRLLANISSVSYRLRRLYFGRFARGRTHEWASGQLDLIADNFLVCRSWLLLPKEDTLEFVRRRTVEYCNAFLIGNLDALPRQALGPEDGLAHVKPRHKRIRMIGFALMVLGYCALPFGVAFIMKSHVDIPQIPESLWLLGYSLWIVLGLYSHLQHSSDDPRTTLVDLLKSFIGR